MSFISVSKGEWILRKHFLDFQGQINKKTGVYENYFKQLPIEKTIPVSADKISFKCFSVPLTSL